jgi:uncharacterized protein (DUF1697 family)
MSDARVAALLRAVNVGGRNRVPMAELRAALTAGGFANVKTLLQSGNVALDCKQNRVRSVAAEIEAILRETFGVQSAVVIRNSSELADAMAADPIISSMTDPSRHLVGFASEAPQAGKARDLEERDFGDDLLRVVGQHVYLWCPAGLSASAFAKLNLERALGVTITVRNWRTVSRLAELVGESARVEPT